MNIEKIDLNLLVVLNTLLKYRSVTATAERLHVSQPAVSHALARLRLAFDDPLLVRTQGHMEPTAKALRLQLPLRQKLDSLQNLLSEQSEFVPEKLDETIYIGATDYADIVLLSEVFERIRKAAPKLRVVTRTVVSNDLNKHLASGEIDGAIVFSADPMPGIHEETLLEDRYVCLSKYSNNEELTLEQYLMEKHVQVSQRRSLGAVADEVLKQNRLARNVMLSTPYCVAAASAAARSGLVMTTAGRVAQHLAKEFPLNICDVPFDMPPIELKLVWHSRTQSDAVHNWFRSIVRDVATTLNNRQ